MANLGAICLSLAVLCPSLSIAQNEQWDMTASDHIEAMQSGSLIVLLKSEHKKIEALQSIANDTRQSNRQRKKAKKLIEKTIQSRDHFHRQLIQGMHRYFTIAPTYFISDYQLDAFRSGDPHILLDSTLQTLGVTAQELKSPFYFAREGFTSGSQGAQTHVYAIYDAAMNPIHSLPAVKITRIGFDAWLKLLVGKSTYRDGNKIAESWNSMLLKRLI